MRGRDYCSGGNVDARSSIDIQAKYKMEALSRREEEEVEAACKTRALKMCDDVVKGRLACTLLLTGRVCEMRRGTNVLYPFCVWR